MYRAQSHTDGQQSQHTVVGSNEKCWIDHVSSENTIRSEIQIGMEKRSSGAGGRGTSRFQRASRSGPPPSSSSTSWKPRRGGASAGRGEGSGRRSPACEHDHTDGCEDEASNPTLIGTCLDMCPEKERAQRERLRDLSVFERLNGNPDRTSPSLAVKKFCRTISAKHVQPSDIRPPAVLLTTLKYLLSLMDISEQPFEVVHDFLFDRMRSIRQELSMQGVVNDQAIYMCEEMVKFHVESHQKLARCCSKLSDVSSLSYLNKEQLMKCLLSLFELYNINRRKKPTNKNEAEFYSLYVLLRLGRTILTMEDALSLWFRQLPLAIVQSKEMRFARTLLRYLRIGNYRCFFSTVAAEASQLQLCLIEPLLNEVRAQAISYINYSGYKLHPYPLAHLAQVLMIKESDLESLCHECSLEIITDETGSVLLPAKQTSFSLPKAGFHSYSLFDARETL